MKQFLVILVILFLVIGLSIVFCSKHVIATPDQTVYFDSTTIVEPDIHVPYARFVSPYDAYVHDQIKFDGSPSYDLEGEIVLYEWDFGDGNTATGISVYHTYNETGLYKVKLTVEDEAGNRGSYAQNIWIEEQPMSFFSPLGILSTPLGLLIILCIVIISVIVVLITYKRKRKTPIIQSTRQLNSLSGHKKGHTMVDEVCCIRAVTSDKLLAWIIFVNYLKQKIKQKNMWFDSNVLYF